MLTIPERIAQVAEHIASHDSHGYSQNNRAGDGTTESVTLSDGSKVVIHGGDYDCSEMVRVCVNCALSNNYRAPIAYLWTGNEHAELTAQGFVRMAYDPTAVRRGDILWVKGHTGVALGNGKQADAHGDESGGITGPRRGDQTGHEVEVRELRSWTYIYRRAGSQAIAASFRATAAGETNARPAPSMSATATGTLRPGEYVECDGWLEAEGRIWATYLNYKGQRRYISLGYAHNWVVVS